MKFEGSENEKKIIESYEYCINFIYQLASTDTSVDIENIKATCSYYFSPFLSVAATINRREEERQYLADSYYEDKLYCIEFHAKHLKMLLDTLEAHQDNLIINENIIKPYKRSIHYIHEIWYINMELWHLEQEQQQRQKDSAVFASYGLSLFSSPPLRKDMDKDLLLKSSPQSHHLEGIDNFHAISDSIIDLDKEFPLGPWTVENFLEEIDNLHASRYGC